MTGEDTVRRPVDDATGICRPTAYSTDALQWVHLLFQPGFMLELSVLGSGSKGNSTLIRTERTALLVDAGLSARQIGLRLGQTGAAAADLDGILLTHDLGWEGLRVELGGVRLLP